MSCMYVTGFNSWLQYIFNIQLYTTSIRGCLNFKPSKPPLYHVSVSFSEKPVQRPVYCELPTALNCCTRQSRNTHVVRELSPACVRNPLLLLNLCSLIVAVYFQCIHTSSNDGGVLSALKTAENIPPIRCTAILATAYNIPQ